MHLDFACALDDIMFFEPSCHQDPSIKTKQTSSFHTARQWNKLPEHLRKLGV